MCTHGQAASTLSLMGYPGMMSVMVVWMLLGMLLFVAVVAAIVWLLVRASSTSAQSSAPPTPYYTPYDHGQRENTIFPDASPRDQERHDELPVSSSYEQPQAQYPKM
ncbi:MAG: hypothetical protein NVS4B12_15710 [Ktedonobacteraceae bacterium]